MSNASESTMENGENSVENKEDGVPPELRWLLDEISEEEDEVEEDGDEPPVKEKYHGIPHPRETVESWESLTQEQKDVHLKDWKRKRNTAAKKAQRARDRRRLIRKRNVEDALVPRRLQTLVVEDIIRVGDSYSSREAIKLRVMELCEATMNVPIFDTSDTHISARTYPPAGNFTPLFLNARINRKNDRWEVTQLTIPSQAATDRSKAKRTSAYTAKMLAPVLYNLVHENPNPDKTSVSTILSQYVRTLTADLMRLALEEAKAKVYGVPEENVKHVNSLVNILGSKGIPASFTVFSARDMLNQVRRCRQDEHITQEARKKAQRASLLKRIARDYRNPTAEETERLQELERVPVRDMMKEWLDKDEVKAQLLKIQGGQANFLRSISVCFPGGMQAAGSLLEVFMMDGIHGHGSLCNFTILSLIGISSNKDVVPLAVSVVPHNESDKGWRDFFHFFNIAWEDRLGRSFNCRAHTLVCHEDEGILSACREQLNDVHLFYCQRHRFENLCRSTNGGVAREFKAMANCGTMAQLSAAKSSFAQNHPEAHRKYVFRVDDDGGGEYKAPPDEAQFPAAAVNAGAKLYGYWTSSPGESWNAAIQKASSLDPVSAVLYLLDIDAKMFNENQQKLELAQRLNKPAPPNILQELEKVSSGFTNDVVVTRLNISKFNVRTAKDVSYAVSLAEPENATSRFGTCQCGIPATQMFPCKHMIAVAKSLHIPHDNLLPEAFSMERWKSQYPSDVVILPIPRQDVFDTTRNDVDQSLRLPISGPPKKGRPPSAKRKRCVLEDTLASV